MQANSLTEAGGVLLCIGGIVTVAFLTQDANFGFILPLLHVMNMGVLITLMGFIALWYPKYAALAGAVGIGVAAEVFFVSHTAPLWSLPAMLGGVACIAGGLTARFGRPSSPLGT